MKKLIISSCVLCVLSMAPCFAINFGPGPGGGNNSAEKVKIQEKNEELLVEEEENQSPSIQDVKKS